MDSFIDMIGILTIGVWFTVLGVSIYCLIRDVEMIRGYKNYEIFCWTLIIGFLISLVALSAGYSVGDNY